MLSLNNIRSCSAKTALDNIINPEKIQALNFEQVDFAKSSIECLKRFENLKYLNLIKVKNCKLSNLEFLSGMKNLERINIENNIIKFDEINNIMKCNFNKKIQVALPTDKKEAVANSLEIQENGKVIITINNNKLKELTENLDLYKLDDIIVIISDNNNFREHISNLKKVKGKISIAIKDASCLSVKDAKILKDDLKLKYINIIDFDGVLQYEKNRYCYFIENYIKIRTEIDKLLEPVIQSNDELLKFLQVYKILGETIVYDELVQEELIDYSIKNATKSSNLENGLLEKKCIDSGFAEILKNILACLGIQSNIIRGILVGTNSEHVWNQVKLLDKWYNVDLGLDSKRMNNSNNKKSKPIYCLVSDKVFVKTHIPQISKVEYCPESFDRKIVSSYFKRELRLKQYFEIVFGNIKRILKFNKQKALPEGKGKHEK